MANDRLADEDGCEMGFLILNETTVRRNDKAEKKRRRQSFQVKKNEKAPLGFEPKLEESESSVITNYTMKPQVTFPKGCTNFTI